VRGVTVGGSKRSERIRTDGIRGYLRVGLDGEDEWEEVSWVSEARSSG
jgi:hypothetical protein